MGRREYFFKRYDRYAKNVTLTYKKSGAFETSCGGLATIISFTILAYWLAVNIAYAFIDYGSYTTSTATQLTQATDGSYPLYTMNKYDFFVTFNISSITNKTQEEIATYI